MQLVPPVLTGQSQNRTEISEIFQSFLAVAVLPIHENNSFADAPVTDAPDGDRLAQDRDGSVLQIDPTA